MWLRKMTASHFRSQSSPTGGAARRLETQPQSEPFEPFGLATNYYSVDLTGDTLGFHCNATITRASTPPLLMYISPQCRIPLRTARRCFLVSSRSLPATARQWQLAA